MATKSKTTTAATVAPPEEKPATVTAAADETEALKARLEVAESKLRQLGVGGVLEQGVKIRMSLGLSRQEAVDAEIRQQAHDAALKKYGEKDSEEKRLAIIHAGTMSSALI